MPQPLEEEPDGGRRGDEDRDEGHPGVAADAALRATSDDHAEDERRRARAREASERVGPRRTRCAPRHRRHHDGSSDPLTPEVQRPPRIEKRHAVQIDGLHIVVSLGL